MQPSFLFVHTHYPEFLQTIYASNPALEGMSFAEQQNHIFSQAFAQVDAYSDGLRSLGCESNDIIVNADHLQQRWADDHNLTLAGNIHDRRRQIVAAQIDHYRPDVLYVFEWCPLGDEFLADIKSQVKLVVGQVASPLHENRTYAAYDLMISSWPPLVDHFRERGIASAYLKLAIDRRIIEQLDPQPLRRCLNSAASNRAATVRERFLAGDGPLPYPAPAKPVTDVSEKGLFRDALTEGQLPQEYDVTFVGGFASSRGATAPSHTERITWLESLLEVVDIDVFGYGVENTPASSPIRSHHRGEAWGWRMYRIFQQSRITLNRHARIEIRGHVSTRYANNLRLYEATGAGTCILTENRENLADMFEPDREVVVYDNLQDCVDKIRFYLEHDAEREAIAEAGKRRTLRDHTYDKRMEELISILRDYL